MRRGAVAAAAAAALLCAAPPAAHACSGWVMKKPYIISGRTFDVGPESWYMRQGTGVSAVPRGSPAPLGLNVKYGFVGLFAKNNLSDGGPGCGGDGSDGFAAEHGGLNEMGLSCDEQHLTETVYGKPTGNASLDLTTCQMCTWALGQFANIAEVKAGIKDVVLIPGQLPAPEWADSPTIPDGGHHYIFKDKSGASLVVEFGLGPNGSPNMYDDFNDDGVTGYGVVTNSPPFDWQLTTIKFQRWEDSLGKTQRAVTVPGGWYPPARFQRAALVKSGLPPAKSRAHAISQALTVMDTVTVPEGAQRATDSPGDYTTYGTLYDHDELDVYWRTAVNHQLRRVRLRDCGLTGGAIRVLGMDDGGDSWAQDVTARLHPAR